MSKKRERRAAAVTDVAEDGRTFTARVVAYDTIDDYGTRFTPGVFTESLGERMPVLAWSHDWGEPIGRATDHDDRDDGLYMTFHLSDPDAVPRARQARAQLGDGTLTDVSVGFMRRASRDAEDEEGVVDITKADLDEVSIVLRGAVPGAQILSVRSGAVSVDAVVEIAKRKAAGELSDEEAQAALALLSSDESDDDDSSGADAQNDDDDGSGDDDGTPDPEAAAVAEQLDADLDAALELVERQALR